jgi:hypothetical protein
VELCGLQNRVERGRDLGSSTRLRAVVVLASDDRSADRALCGVVIGRNPRVLDEERESIPDPSVYAQAVPSEMCLSPARSSSHSRNVARMAGASARPEFADSLEVAFAAVIDLVERTDPFERALGARMIRHRFFESSKGIRPTTSESNSRTCSSASLVSAQCVGDDRSDVVADEHLEGSGTLVVANPMHDHARLAGTGERRSRDVST